MGRHQPPQRNSEEVRGQQCSVVSGFVEELLGVDPRARLVVLGDTNEHQWRLPIQFLAGSNLLNLIDQVPEKERYTFIYEGRSQVLDNVLISPELVEKAAPEIDIVHVNADFPAGHRASDHDPVVVRLNF
jgi:predicted extracellular nuclease